MFSMDLVYIAPDNGARTFEASSFEAVRPCAAGTSVRLAGHERLASATGKTPSIGLSSHNSYDARQSWCLPAGGLKLGSLTS